MSKAANPLEAPPVYLEPPIGEMMLEVVVIPVSDVDRAKRFYADLGWRLDLDFAADDGYRVIQFTPPASSCSIIFGAGITTAAPGSAQGLHLIVADVGTTCSKLRERGVEVSEPFHDSRGVFHHIDGQSRVHAAHPQRRSYGTYASFKDPDGNSWFFQEVTARLPGHEAPLPK
ncbi:MAG TPA: VOC family protein [Steroidobacter sp.]|uniref:VOC family protein n=1 Tax=Steroidobacter sp. TaxID=1978227 RepID=UPI002ED95051